jgi:hypothetical protein
VSALPHKFGDTWEQQLLLGYHGSIEAGFLSDQLVDQSVVGWLPMLAQQAQEAVMVIVANQPAEIVGVRDFHLMRFQHRVESLEMKGLGIG